MSYVRQSHLNEIREQANQQDGRIGTLEQYQQRDRKQTSKKIREIQAHYGALEYNVSFYFAEAQRLRAEVDFLRGEIQDLEVANSARFKALEDRIQILETGAKNANKRIGEREKASNATDKLMAAFQRRLGCLEWRISENYPYAKMSEIERKFLADELQRLEDASK